MKQPLIEFQGVSKTFPRAGGQMLLRNYLGVLFQRHSKQVFYAVKDVSFKVEHGESVAVIGSNGAGKSTLLSLVAGLSPPDEGTVTVNGKVAPLLELGVGFHTELTGKENVRLNASLMGVSRRRMNQIFDQIVDFSGVSEFINEPLRTYSSGMKLRLAFAVAIHCEPEILLTDEVLTVGDKDFQVQCLAKIKEFRRAGKTLLCVSHSPGMVETLCDTALWLEHGQLVMTGKVSDVLRAYTAGAKASV